MLACTAGRVVPSEGGETMREGRVSTDRRLRLRRRADCLRHRRHRSRDLGIRVHPRPHRARKHQRSARRTIRPCRSTPSSGPGEPVDTGRKALAMAEIMREHTLSSTGGLTYAEMGRYQSAENPERPGGDERRGRGGEGRERPADLEQRPQHLGHGDGSRDCARHGIHVGDARDLQHRRRRRVAVDRDRPGDPGEGGVRTRESSDTGRASAAPRARTSSRIIADSRIAGGRATA